MCDDKVICPECKQEFDNDGDGHAFDAVKEYGKCHECLGYCPYCNFYNENEEWDLA